MEDPSPPLRDLIAKVCERPQMYVANDGFRAACYFIMGYATGRGGEEREEERDFSRWLGLRLCKKSGLVSNCIWMAHLTAVYPDETQAYQELAKWYKKFLRSRKSV